MNPHGSRHSSQCICPGRCMSLSGKFTELFGIIDRLSQIVFLLSFYDCIFTRFVALCSFKKSVEFGFTEKLSLENSVLSVPSVLLLPGLLKLIRSIPIQEVVTDTERDAVIWVKTGIPISPSNVMGVGEVGLYETSWVETMLVTFDYFS